jgi:hypothetical protein
MASHVLIYAGKSEDFFRVESSISKNTTDYIQISSSEEKDRLQRGIPTFIESMPIFFTKITLTESHTALDIQLEKRVAEDSKRELWEILMGDTPMPDTSSDAIQEYSDALKAIVHTEGEENPLIDRLWELRGK